MPVTSPEFHAPVNQLPRRSPTASDSSRSYSPQSSVCRVLNILADNELVAPERHHLELIASFAVEAQRLFFTAAAYHPDEAQLIDFFNKFVLMCALPAPLS